jgi:hypothetical protein
MASSPGSARASSIFGVEAILPTELAREERLVVFERHQQEPT